MQIENVHRMLLLVFFPSFYIHIFILTCFSALPEAGRQTFIYSLLMNTTHKDSKRLLKYCVGIALITHICYTRNIHYENTLIQIYWKFYYQKKRKFSDKKFCYFSYFCSKHRLWVLVRTASSSGSNEYPQSMFFSRNKKNNVYPCKPQFYYIKVGFKGVKSI